MFNQSYINDFSEQTYINYLNSKDKLTMIKKNYLSQFSDEDSESLDAQKLAFKESLDHYILKRLEENTDFIKSKEFINYIKYIMDIVVKRKFTASNNTFYLEFNTNIVFRNPKIRETIFKEFFSEVNTVNNNNLIELNNNIISNITNRLKKREKVSQKELDFLGDYIYTSGDFSNDIAKTFVEYIFNELDNNPTIKSSVSIMGAVTSYFTQCYTKDDRVKNSRIFIGDNDGSIKMSSKKNPAHSSGYGKYCVFSKELVLDAALTSTESTKKGRTFDNNDLYFLMMVSFHELTHEYQKNKAKDKICTSSGISYIVKNVLNRYLSKKDEDGKIIESEYTRNHNSTEYEMEADEESWRQCSSFIASHCRWYCYNHHLDSGKAMKLEMQCLKNAEEINGRRTFSLKVDNDGNLMLYSIYDIKNLIQLTKKHPDIIETYPMLETYFSKSGDLRIDALFKNITDTDNGSGLNFDNYGIDFATYMIDYGNASILQALSTGKVTEDQINNLMINTWNVVHRNVLKIRNFEKANLDNYNETKHKYNLKEKENQVFNYYFKKCAKELDIVLQIIYQIKKVYPNIDVTRYFQDFKINYKEWFIELFSKTREIKVSDLKEICEKYDASNTPELRELSNIVKYAVSQNNVKEINHNITQENMTK